MMDLNSGMIPAHNQFLKTIPAEKLDNAWEALNILLTHQIYPICEDWPTIGDLQKYDDEGTFPSNSSLDFKLMYLLDKFEHDNKKFCMALLFLVKFYLFVQAQCPEFLIPFGDLKEDTFYEYTSIFARVGEQLEISGSKLLQDSFKDFVGKIGEQLGREYPKEKAYLIAKTKERLGMETPIKKVVTQLKDQIVCAQIENDDRVWANMKSTPIDQQEGYDEII